MPIRAMCRALLALVCGLASSFAPAQNVSNTSGARSFSCSIAPADPAHDFAAVGVDKGATLTNLVIGSGDGPTSVVKLRVSPGEKPMTLYLAAASSVVWDITGVLARIERVIVAGSDDRAAIRGLPRDRIEFAQGLRCGLPGSQVARLRPQSWLRSFGRTPDRVVYGERAYEVTLPEGIVDQNRRKDSIRIARLQPDGRERERVVQLDLYGRGPATKGERELSQFYLGGYREIDPAALTASAEVRIPQTFPAQAGLIQLEESGAIRAPAPDEVKTWAEAFTPELKSRPATDYVKAFGFDHVVTRPIELPAGLYGAMGQNFLLLPSSRARQDAGTAAWRPWTGRSRARTLSVSKGECASHCCAKSRKTTAR